MVTGDYKHRHLGLNESRITSDMLKNYHILQSNSTARRLTSADLPNIHLFKDLILKINAEGKLIAGKTVLNRVGRNRAITILKDPNIETKDKAATPKTPSITSASPKAGVKVPSTTSDTTVIDDIVDPATVPSPTALPDDNTVIDVIEATEEELAQMLLDLQKMADHPEGAKKAKEEHVSKISTSAQQVFKGRVAVSGKNAENRMQEQIQAERTMLQQQSSEKAAEQQKRLKRKRDEKNVEDDLKAAEKKAEANKFDEKRAQIKKEDLK